MIKKVFHPFLLTLVPVLYLWTANVDFIAPHMVFRSIVVALLLATGLLVLAYFLARDWQQAAILTSVALLIFFLYGHLYVLLKQISPLLSLIRHRYLLAITVLFLATVFLLISRYKKIIPSITLFLSIMGVLLVSFMSARLLLYQGTKTIPVEPVDVGFDVVTTARTTAPDIYYIILDAYGRQDVLWDIYRYDNSEFIQALEERGFYIVV